MKPMKQSSPANESPPERLDILKDWSAKDLLGILERFPVGVYACDADGLVTYFNERAAEIWGRAPELRDTEERYTGSLRLFERDGTPLEPERSWMARALEDETDYEGREVVVERPDGSRRVVLAHAKLARDEDGRVLGAVEVLVDITRHKEGEDALRESDRAKDQFLATLAHELRNPLAPVRHAMQILERQGVASQEGDWALRVIGRQVKQMSRLIDDLVDLSRIPENQLALYRQPVEVADVVRFALDATREQVEEKSQTLTVDVPDETIWLDADPIRLSQALTNILENAVEYTQPRGEIDLTVRRGEEYVTLTVEDDGRGIPPAMLGRIFEAFTQMEEGPSGARSGLGISLPLVKEIVEKHGGDVEVASEGEGQGTRFTLRLPVAEEALQPAPTVVEPEAEPRPGGLRVLVVDDNQDSAFSLARLLELEDHQCHTAYDGLRAVELAAEVKPDVVVLDIELPGIDGYEAARRIRALPGGHKILLVALTGWGQDRDRRRAKDAGFDHHLIKPVSAELLLDLLPD